MIEIARAFTQGCSRAPKRSILFLFVTAEEQGLLGSGYYAATPLYPLAKTAAAINIDGPNMYGQDERPGDRRPRPLGPRRCACRRRPPRQGRVVKPDPEPEKGGYYRSDHFPFAKQGVPSLNAGGGDDYIGKPPDYGKKLRDDYTGQRLPQAVRRGEARLGPERRGAGSRAVSPGRLRRRAGGDVAGVEARHRVQGEAPVGRQGPGLSERLACRNAADRVRSGEWVLPEEGRAPRGG